LWEKSLSFLVLKPTEFNLFAISLKESLFFPRYLFNLKISATISNSSSFFFSLFLIASNPKGGDPTSSPFSFLYHRVSFVLSEIRSPSSWAKTPSIRKKPFSMAVVVSKGSVTLLKPIPFSSKVSSNNW